MKRNYRSQLPSHGFTRTAGSDYHYDDGDTVLCTGPKAIWGAYDFAGNRTPHVDSVCLRLHLAGLPLAKHLLPKESAA